VPLPRLAAALALALTACGGPPADPAAADRAAIATLHDEYATHFNQGHATAVADLMADSAVFLGADGSVDLGRAQIVAGLEASFAGKPTLTLAPAETIVLGDRAFTRGGYSLAMSPPAGAPLTLAGNYLTAFGRQDGAWKITAVLTNYDATPPAGVPWDSSTAGTPPADQGTMGDLVTAFTTHFNAGHAAEVAALFTDSAVAMFADTTPATGRAAIERHLAGVLAQGAPQITIHDVGTEVLPEGWAFDGGWWVITATAPEGPRTRIGGYVLLARQQADGSWRIHWFASNAGPER
jgi:uncharacterized protein (TIGR02246 family)